MLPRQVSWLAGHSSVRPSRIPCGLQWLWWTAARRLQLRGQLRPCTGFPLSCGPNATRRTSTSRVYAGN